jgi:hypothetical protein
MNRTRLLRTAGLVAACLLPAFALAAGVHVLFDTSSVATSPFPSDRFTVEDHGNITDRRVNLPLPNCVTNPSDCADLSVINTLDGFNVQPRLSIPFSGPIDLSSVSSRSVFLVRLEGLRDEDRRHAAGDRIVGINQILWDPATLTLHAEANELLDQDTRYLLVVTTEVRDTKGKPIEAIDFLRYVRSFEARDEDGIHRPDNRRALLEGFQSARVDLSRVAVATVFTTQSATGLMERVRNQIQRKAAPKSTFDIGTMGEHTVFDLSAISFIQWNREVGTAPVFQASFLPTPALSIFPGSISKVAFGKYSSPDYENSDRYIPEIASRRGEPKVQSTNDIYFTLFVPGGTEPAAGWPVAIFGHGFTDSRHGAPWAVASTLASRGIAVIAINVVGHGGGALGTLVVNTTGGTVVTLPDGGRGVDQDGNGTIDSTEGVNASAAFSVIGNRDGLRQTVIDLMQLVHVIQGGVSLDGTSKVDLDPKRIYYSGQSFGGIYGVQFLGVESDVHVGVPNVAGGAITEVARLGSFRFLTGISLVTRLPVLFNGPPPDPNNLATFTLFNENIPLRDQPTVINNVPGAMAIQTALENACWVSQPANPVAYAPHIRLNPLPGSDAKRIIFQFAKGDETVPNPTASAVVRAGHFIDRTMFYRNDLAFAANPGIPTNPHTFLTNIAIPAAAPYAIGAQTQIAVFFATDGMTTINPVPGIFETPIAGPLPETLNFLP